MRPWLILDTETTGLDPETDRIVEVGAVLFDPNAGVPVACGSRLVASETNEAESINRIPAGVLGVGEWVLSRENANVWVRAFAQMGSRSGPEGVYSPIFLAHNAAFDRAFLPDFETWDWLCTKEDAHWPRLPKGTGKLVEIALAYDVGVVRAHRAIEDCLTLAACLTRVHEIEGGLEPWLARAQEERVVVQAIVSFEDKDLAKDRGFGWNPDTRQWTKRVRVSELAEVVEECPFAAVVVR